MRRPSSVARAPADAPVILEELRLHHGELRRQHLHAKMRIGGDTCVSHICDEDEKLIKPATLDGRNDAELGVMSVDRIGELGALAVEHQPPPVQHHHALLVGRLDRHKPHRWPRDGLELNSAPRRPSCRA